MLGEGGVMEGFRGLLWWSARLRIMTDSIALLQVLCFCTAIVQNDGHTCRSLLAAQHVAASPIKTGSMARWPDLLALPASQ